MSVLVSNLNQMDQIKITTRGAKRIRNGHLWVYRSDVREATDVKGGAIVRAVDEAGNLVGQAFYSDASEIALRFLTTRDEKIDREWWISRLRRCRERRAAISQETNAYRLVYSEGDLLSSLIVDVYDNVFVVQTLSQGAEQIKALLVESIVQEFKPRAVVERNDARIRELEGLNLQSSVLFGEAPEEIEINQHGVRIIVSPLSGQKTGAFLDQRENYLAAKRFAHGKALDCFTFNGGFTLHIASECANVIGIDISSDAVSAARHNAELNGAGNVDFRSANVFDALREFESIGERFDMIILDPPAFAKNRATVKSGARGYKEINLRALKLLHPGGVLVTCSCSYHISEQLFLEIIADAALDARRRVQLIEKRGQSGDHPVLLGVPETHYLKCLLARVIE